MSAPAWAWDETAAEVVELPPDDRWRRPDGQERVITHLWPPEPWAPLEGVLSRCLAVCEWLDARMLPFWEDALIVAGCLGLLTVIVAVLMP